MHIHSLKVIMYVYDISASYRLDLQFFLGILILFSFWWISIEVRPALKQANSQVCKSFQTIASYPRNGLNTKM